MGGGVGENASLKHRWWHRSEAVKSRDWRGLCQAEGYK
jgi:hypothetical protein